MSEDPPEGREPELLTARQVATIFSVDIRCLWNWAKSGVLVPATRIRVRRYYARADVDCLKGLGRQ